ncbi:MAG: PAS domain S-box protein, partial [Promethearchaeota archaeon]
DEDYEYVGKEKYKQIQESGIGTVETRFKTKDGKIIDVLLRSAPINPLDLSEGISLAVLDITERKKAEQLLKESEEKFRTMAEQSLMGIIILQDNQIKYLNSTALAMLNYTREEILKFNSEGFINFIHPDDRKIVLDMAEKRQKGIETEVSGYEHRALKKNGEIIWIQNYSKSIYYEGNLADMVTVIDITERKKAEEKIRDSEKKLTDLLEAVPVGISITSSKGKILDCNSHAYKLFGYNVKDEFLNTPVLNFYQNPIDRARFLKLHEEGLVKDFEIQFKRKDGTIFWGSLTSVAHQVGNQTMFINSFQDITFRKRNELKLQQSEAELSAIYEYTPIAIFLVDKEHHIRKINKFALNYTDRREEEVFGIHGGEALHCIHSIQDPRGCGFSKQCQDCVIRNTILDTYKTKTPHINIEATLSLLPGKITDKAHLLISTVPLKFGGEDLVLISLIDITERKNAEQRLKESEERFKYLVSSSPAIIYTSKTTGDYGATFISNNVEEIWGYDPKNFIEDSEFWLNNILPDDREFVLTKLLTLEEKDHIIYEYRLKLNDNKYHWMRDEVMLIRDEVGNPIETIGSVIDITDRVNVEQELKKSEEKYKNLIKSINDLIIEVDLNRKITYASPQVRKILGYEPEEIIGLSVFDLIHSDEKLFQKDEILNAFHTDKPLFTEYRVKHKNGHYVILAMRGNVVKIEDNIKIVGVFRDITENKIAEEKLMESEEKFRNIAEQTSLGLLIQQDGIIKFANSALADISEYSLQEINNWSIEDVIKIIHREDLSFINTKLDLVRNDDFETFEQFECRLITKSGNIKWLEIIAKPIIYLGYKAIFASLIDITAKKKLEEELKEISRLKSELLSRTSHELKTPLVSIKGYADLLLNQHYEMLDIYTVSILNEIKQGCTRLESLIKDLLETSKLEAEEIQLDKIKDDLAFLIRFCIRELKGLIETRKHELILDI